jgi:F5/8 type C domain-containing protein
LNPKLDLPPDFSNKLVVILLALSLFVIAEFQLNNTLAKSNEHTDVNLDRPDTKSNYRNNQDSTLEEDIPSVELSYGGKTHKMLPFVVVQDQDIHKLNFPQLPDDFKPTLRIPQEEAFSLVFDSKPRETNAFIIDYDADVTEISPVNKLGKNSFSISGVHGPRTLEVRTIYPNDEYVTYTLLVDVGKNGPGSNAEFIGEDLAEPAQTSINLGTSGQESNIQSYQSSNEMDTASVAERIQSEYGGIIEASNPVETDSSNPVETDSSNPVETDSSNPVETDMIRPVPEKSTTGSSCMDFEIPVENMTTRNNSTITDSSMASNTTQESTPWVQIDLGSSKQICGLNVQFKEDPDKVRFFTVEVSTDGTLYSEPKYYSNSGSGTSGEIYNLDEEPVSARYIKVTELGRNGTDTNWASEIKVLGLKD